MTVRIVTQPAVEPITVAQARAWCRIDGTDEDSILEILIKSMREYAEEYTGRAFVQRQLELTMDSFDGREIHLPYPPLLSVTHIKYIAYDGTLTTIDPDDYEVNTYEEPGEVQPAYLQVWPGVRDVFNAVQIRYLAGYAPTDGSPTDYTANIPAALKQWMMARIATAFEHREQLIVGATVNPLPRHFADGLLDGLKIGEGMFG